MRICHTSTPYSGRWDRCTAQIAVVVHLNAIGHPGSQLHRIGTERFHILFWNNLTEERLIRCQHFIAYTRITDKTAEILCIFAKARLHVVYQYFKTDIAQVFRGNSLQKVYSPLFWFIGTQAGKEITDHQMITAWRNQNLSHGFFIQFILLRKVTSRFITHKRSYIRIANGIFLCHPAIISGTLFGSNFRHIDTFGRRNNIHFHHVIISCCFIQLHCQIIILPKWKFGISELTILRSPYQHIAFTGSKECFSPSICLFTGHSIKFSIIVYFKFHLCVSHRIPFGIHHGYLSFSCRGIIINYIDLCIIGSFIHYFFRTVVSSEDFRMHQHSTWSRSVKPT